MRRALLSVAVLLVAVVSPAQTWSDFQWGTVERSGRTFNRALVYLPVQLEGLKGQYRMLLDTTASETELYGPLYRRMLEESQGGSAVEKIPAAGSGKTRLRTTLTVGSFVIRNKPVHLNEGFEPPETFDGAPIIGTVGLDLLRERVWLLDLGRGRFSILDEGASLPKALESRAYYVEAAQRDERMFITVSAGSLTFADFLFDTTANVMPVLTTKPIWQKATGRWGDEKNNQKLTEKAGDADVVYLGYRSIEPLRLGSRPLGRAGVYMVEAGPDNLRPEKWPFRASGVIGLAAFNGATVIVDLPKNRLGLLGPLRKG